MTNKEIAAATVELFFKHLGLKVQVKEALGKDSFAQFADYDYRNRYTVAAESFNKSPEAIVVRVYDFSETASRDRVFEVRATPELAGKFTLEAIDAYEKELGDAA